MKKGWHNESYRHSLAARGVRTSLKTKSLTRTSMLFKKDEAKQILDVFKSPAERYDQGHEISKSFATRIRDKLMGVMADLEAKGLMTLEDNRRFMEDQYAPLEEKFVNRHMDGNVFKDEVDRSYRLYYQHNKKKNSIMGFGQSESDQEPTIFGPEEKKGTSIWGF